MTLLKVHEEPDPVAVVRAWCNAAGPAMARVAFPVGFESGRLEVAVPDRAWLRELESRREELMRRLRSEKRMDQLREIAFVLGTTPGRQEPMTSPPACESKALELSPEILNAAQAIPDEDLSRRWTAAISRMLGAVRPNHPGR